MKCATKPSNIKPRRDEKTSKAKESLSWFLHANGFTPEVYFSGVGGRRKWRVDWLKGKVAVEYQGKGRGHDGMGAWRDHDKITELTVCGFVAIQCNARSVNDGRCFKWIEQAMEGME